MEMKRQFHFVLVPGKRNEYRGKTIVIPLINFVLILCLVTTNNIGIEVWTSTHSTHYTHYTCPAHTYPTHCPTLFSHCTHYTHCTHTAHTIDTLYTHCTHYIHHTYYTHFTLGVSKIRKPNIRSEQNWNLKLDFDSIQYFWQISIFCLVQCEWI